jgi:hypothetical protein
VKHKLQNCPCEPSKLTRCGVNQAHFSLDGQKIGQKKVEISFLSTFPSEELIERLAEDSGGQALLKKHRADSADSKPARRGPDKPEYDYVTNTESCAPSEGSADWRNIGDPEYGDRKERQGGPSNAGNLRQDGHVKDNRVSAEGVMRGMQLLELKRPSTITTKLKPSAKEFVPSMCTLSQDSTFAPDLQAAPSIQHPSNASTHAILQPASSSGFSGALPC